MSLSAKLRRAPLRVVTGAYILNSGIGKLSADEDTAKAMHGMASGTYPFLGNVPSKTFATSLGIGEIALGSALLLPIVPPFVAGAALVGFSGALLNMYWHTPGLHRDGDPRPTADGVAIAKDSWMFGIGTALIADALVEPAHDKKVELTATVSEKRSRQSRRAKRKAAKAADKAAKVSGEQYAQVRAAVTAAQDEAAKQAAKKAKKAQQARAKAQAKAQAKAEHAQQEAQQRAAKLQQEAQQRAEKATKRLAELRDEYAPVAMEKAQKAAKQARDAARSIADEYGPAAAEKAQKAAHQAREAVQETASRAQDAAERAKERIAG
jgi:uncharacterized membrane protein YphA (DoxX/SURF4 family)